MIQTATNEDYVGHGNTHHGDTGITKVHGESAKPDCRFDACARADLRSAVEVTRGHEHKLGNNVCLFVFVVSRDLQPRNARRARALSAPCVSVISVSPWCVFSMISVISLVCVPRGLKEQMPWPPRSRPAHGRLAKTARNSNIRFAARSAVICPGPSNDGATSTTSQPITERPASPRTSSCAS
jgi:hypothetical protein